MSVIDTSKLKNGNFVRVLAMDTTKTFQSYLGEVLPAGFTYMTGCGKAPCGTGLDGRTLYQYRLMNKQTLESFFITEEYFTEEQMKKNKDGSETTETVNVRQMMLLYEE